MRHKTQKEETMKEKNALIEHNKTDTWDEACRKYILLNEKNFEMNKK